MVWAPIWEELCLYGGTWRGRSQLGFPQLGGVTPRPTLGLQEALAPLFIQSLSTTKSRSIHSYPTKLWAAMRSSKEETTMNEVQEMA